MPKSHLEMLVIFICSSWLPPEMELTAAPLCFLLARGTVNVVAAQVMLLRVREKEKLALYALPWSLSQLPQLSHSRQLTSGCPGNLGLAWDLFLQGDPRRIQCAQSSPSSPDIHPTTRQDALQPFATLPRYNFSNPEPQDLVWLRITLQSQLVHSHARYQI